MTSEAWLFSGLITGVIGMAYFVYGKKQSQPVPLTCGIALMVYPYFIDSLLITIIIGTVLAVVPFVFKPSP